MKSVFKWLLVLLAGLLSILLLGLFFLLLTYPYEYVRRVLVWQESDYYDYIENFPARRLQPAAQPYQFQEALDEERIAGTFAAVLNVTDLDSFLQEMDTQALLVIQDDQILYEKYFNGASRDTLLTSFSVAKSFTSALIGGAIADGAIGSVDDPITDYLPELAERDARFSQITIRHLLMMASGLDYRARRPALFNGDDPIATYYPDQREAALEFTEIVDPPGQYFNYNKYHPQLLGMILERSIGKSVSEYTQEKLWDQLGMQFEGSWSLDSEGGFEKMEAGLNARALDFAKLGRLYLDDGAWDGRQVLPETWIAESISADTGSLNDDYYQDDFGQTLFHDLGGYYKYMWYGYARGDGPPDFSAIGDHGQFVYVSPQKNLIIVRNGLDFGGDWHWNQWIAAFYDLATEID